MAFKKAVKHDAKGRIALVAPSGGGKTMTALKLAQALADGGKVALLDTEHGSASKYADLFDFDVMEIDNFHPKQYVDAIAEAAREGYAVIILDSLTHAWDGKGGVLEIVARNGNGPQAWNNVKPIERGLFEAIVSAPIHVIATVRAKQKVEVGTDDRGKTTVTKLGLEAVQRAGIEYEFDIVLRLDNDNTATVDKSRCPDLSGQVIAKPGRETGETIRKWLAGAPAPAPFPAPAEVSARPPAEREYAEQRTTISVLGDFAAQHRRELPPATEKQITAIGKLLESLGKPPLDGVLTYEQAREMLAQLSGEFQRARRAPTGGQASLEGLAVGGKN